MFINAYIKVVYTPAIEFKSDTNAQKSLYKLEQFIIPHKHGIFEPYNTSNLLIT